jgi:hypothetical protein
MEVAVANQPHPDRKAVTWRLHRDLVARLHVAAAKNEETTLALVTRALTRELNDPSGHRLSDNEFDEFLAAVRSCRGPDEPPTSGYST